MGYGVWGQRIMAKGQGQEPLYQEWSFRGMGCGVWGIQPIAGHCVILNRSVQRTVREGSLP